MTDQISSRTDLPAPGMTLGGRYRLVSRRGVGGVAEVWEARDERLHRDVAVKILSGVRGGDLDRRDRLEREARALAALSSPRVVSIYDYGEHVGSSGAPVPYLVLELVDGPDLADVLASRRLEPAEALDLLVEILSGVAAAHAVGIVHGDLKPANILMAEDGPKVGDFGVARIVGFETGHTVPAATPSYAAPEVMSGERPGPQADVYSAACIALEALTGAPLAPLEPARALHAPAARRAVLMGVEGIDRRVRETLLRALSDDPDERQTDAAALALAVTEALSPPPVVAAAPTVAVLREPTRVIERTDQPMAKRVVARAVRMARAIPPGIAIAVVGIALILFAREQSTAMVLPPDVIGGDLTAAAGSLESLGFEVEVVQVDQGGVPGTVVDQRPKPGKALPRGSTISLAVTRGVRQILVPDVTGMPLEDAVGALNEAGLLAGGSVSFRSGTSAEPGHVIETDPRPGSTVDEGTHVRIVVGSFPPPEPVVSRGGGDDDDDEAESLAKKIVGKMRKFSD